MRLWPCHFPLCAYSVALLFYYRGINDNWISTFYANVLWILLRTKVFIVCLPFYTVSLSFCPLFIVQLCVILSVIFRLPNVCWPNELHSYTFWDTCTSPCPQFLWRTSMFAAGRMWLRSRLRWTVADSGGRRESTENVYNLASLSALNQDDRRRHDWLSMSPVFWRWWEERATAAGTTDERWT